MTADHLDEYVPRDEDYLLPMLRVLSDGRSRTSGELREAAYDAMGLTEEQRSFVHEKSGQRRVDVRGNFAIHHLRRATAIEGGYGVAQITELGRRLLTEHPDALTRDDLAEIAAYRDYVPQYETPKEPAAEDEIGGQIDNESTAWFVGATFEDPGVDVKRDHSAEFIEQDMWAIHPDSREKLKEQVREMRAGDRIAIKAVYVRKRDVPFPTNGHPVSVMAIKATGTITANPGNGVSVDVTWEQDRTAEPREWYLYTYQGTIWRVVPDSEHTRNLVEFAFAGAEQDLDALRNMPYWADRFGDDASFDLEDPVEAVGGDAHPDVGGAEATAPVYTVESIIEDGCFLGQEILENLLHTVRQKKNLILQGPPGTGKTWLAKRLARALIGKDDASQITAVQFHPTVSYEDFVRGWRPAGDGRLTLVDGALLQIAERAAATPDQDHVLVVEEINRGNLALRRRFGFADLQPEYNLSWSTWISERVKGADRQDIERLGAAVEALNQAITQAPGLGDQYRIGHSFFTPAKSARNLPFVTWARTVVAQEIKPLLTEYWFDQPELVDTHMRDLMAALTQPER